MSIEVSFWIKGKTGVYLCEDELEWYIAELKGVDDLPGYITIASETHHIELTDDLDYIIPELCFSSIPNLSNNLPFHITRASASGSYELWADQTQVWISGPNITATAFEKRGFLAALFQCGLRFLEFLRKLDGNTGQYEGTIDQLESEQIAAKEFIN